VALIFVVPGVFPHTQPVYGSTSAMLQFSLLHLIRLSIVSVGSTSAQSCIDSPEYIETFDGQTDTELANMGAVTVSSVSPTIPLPSCALAFILTVPSLYVKTVPLTGFTDAIDRFKHFKKNKILYA